MGNRAGHFEEQQHKADQRTAGKLWPQVFVICMLNCCFLKESTANVDEWKRQLHTYKEENVRLKRDMDMLCSGGSISAASAAAAAAAGADLNDELKREVNMLKSRIESLQNELMSQEIELKAANMSLRDKNQDQTVS